MYYSSVLEHERFLQQAAGGHETETREGVILLGRCGAERLIADRHHGVERQVSEFRCEILGKLGISDERLDRRLQLAGSELLPIDLLEEPVTLDRV